MDGKGLSTVLKGIKSFTSNITAITTFSSYKENKEIQAKQINKIKDNFIAICSNSNELEQIMENKYANKQNTFWQEYFANIKETFGDYQNGILQTNKIFLSSGQIIPVSLDEMRVCVELKDGTVIENETQLLEVLSDRATKINRTYIKPSNCKVTPGLLDKIKNADVIVFGPGSLYTEIIPNLLIKNVTKTIKESKALKIYISNITNENGQTNDFDVSDYMNAMVEHVGEEVIDFCIYNNEKIDSDLIKAYNRKGESLVQLDKNKIKTNRIKIIEKPIAMVSSNKIIHDSDKIAKVIIETIVNDFKFKDKTNEEKYIFLNSKLKALNKTKKLSQKIKEKNKSFKEKIQKNKENKKNKKKLSKFSNKYQERIESIKEINKSKEL